jgi:hypothetical protein
MTSVVVQETSTGVVTVTAVGPQGAIGATGPTGPSGTTSVGTTTTGAAGTSASVTNSGTSTAAVLNFTIPKGDTGATGAAGTVSAAGNGTAAAPAIAFASDTSTGIYRPGASQLAISTGGTERLRITSANKIGIGTTTPAYSLHLVGNGGSAAGAVNGQFALGDVVGVPSARIDGYRVDGSYAGEMRFYTTVGGGTETRAMTIDSIQRVLVGLTTANSSGGVLQLSSGITFPATQVASADPNTLDDYEEGTWTPGGISGTYSGIYGSYVKIGSNIIYTVIVVVYGGQTFSTTAAKITGLPFATVITGAGSWGVRDLSGGSGGAPAKPDGTLIISNQFGANLMLDATISFTSNGSAGGHRFIFEASAITG